MEWFIISPRTSVLFPGLEGGYIIMFSRQGAGGSWGVCERKGGSSAREVLSFGYIYLVHVVKPEPLLESNRLAETGSCPYIRIG